MYPLQKKTHTPQKNKTIFTIEIYAKQQNISQC